MRSPPDSGRPGGRRFGNELRQRGLDRRHAPLILGFGQWFSVCMFVLVAAVNVVVAVIMGDLLAIDVVPLLVATGAGTGARNLARRMQAGSSRPSNPGSARQTRLGWEAIGVDFSGVRESPPSG